MAGGSTNDGAGGAGGQGGRPANRRRAVEARHPHGFVLEHVKRGEGMVRRALAAVWA